jgi:hypothetical protein
VNASLKICLFLLIQMLSITEVPTPQREFLLPRSGLHYTLAQILIQFENFKDGEAFVGGKRVKLMAACMWFEFSGEAYCLVLPGFVNRVN